MSDKGADQVVLVTGGAGFIGSFLCERLLNDGYHVICLDNFNDFYAPSLKWENLARAIRHPNFILVDGDIRDKELLSNLFEKHTPDIIIHLAAMAGVRPSLENPELYHDVNITGTYNLLEKARYHGVRHFIFASSSSVYGNNRKIPFAESDLVDNPISPYAYTKKAGELLCHLYHQLHGMSVVCLRFFTVYGPRQRPDLAIRKFVECITNSKPITVYGDGSNKRDYTFIDDIIDGIIQSVFYVCSMDCYEVFNLGNSNPVSVAELVALVEEELHEKADVVHLPMQPGDVDITFADIDKSRRLLSYEPKTPFREGIRKFIEWFKSR